MPCNSDYMFPTTRERDLSRVACLLDEVAGRKWTISWWDGYHPTVYNERISKEQGDQMVRELCSLLGSRDVTQYSLEMQVWWRDHQAADKARIRRERQAAKKERRQHEQAAPPDGGPRPLTLEERRWVKRLRRVMADTPEYIWLYAAAGSLCVMRLQDDKTPKMGTAFSSTGADQDWMLGGVVEVGGGGIDGGDW
jgi:hypothetical protein